MIERTLSRLIRETLDRAALELALDRIPEEIEVFRPRVKEHGDYATNIALGIGAQIGRDPREVAEVLVRHLPQSDLLAKVEVAGPGFINLFLAHGWLYQVLVEVERQGEGFGRAEGGPAERVQVEFVSANPTGPLHVGTGRNAIIGDSLARILEATGHSVTREYYVNDTGAQIELFGASVEARYLRRYGREAVVPEGGYQGAYVTEFAERISEQLGDSLLALASEERRARITEEGIRLALDWIRASLDRFGVQIDVWSHQSDLAARGSIDEAVRALLDAGFAYEQDGAIWFAATRFGDTKDRVLIRATGEPTYFAADCAYLRDKFSRGFERLIYVWGADHHGTVQRVKGAAEAYGHDLEKVEFILTQLVFLYRGGEAARMSRRAGEMVTLDELLDEVGVDAARYTLLTRSTDTALDFDIELAKRQSLDNPVYYVQYAHARIASILRYAAEQGVTVEPLERVRPQELVHETELDLLRKIAELPEQVGLAANLRAPYRLTRYAEELAAGFHRFYTECRVVTEDLAVTQARLHLARATKRAIANVLKLLGVSAPESMERVEESR